MKRQFLGRAWTLNAGATNEEFLARVDKMVKKIRPGLSSDVGFWLAELEEVRRVDLQGGDSFVIRKASAKDARQGKAPSGFYVMRSTGILERLHGPTELLSQAKAHLRRQMEEM